MTICSLPFRSGGVADFDNYGKVRLCSLSDIVKSDGLALPASEKNSGLEGTIMYVVDGLKTKVYAKDPKKVNANGNKLEDVLSEVLKPDNFDNVFQRSFLIYDNVRRLWLFADATRWGDNYSGYAFLVGTMCECWMFHRCLSSVEKRDDIEVCKMQNEKFFYNYYNE